MNSSWMSRKFWFGVGSWFFAFLLHVYVIYEATQLLEQKLIADMVWQTVCTGTISGFLMFTLVMLGLHNASNITDKKLNNGHLNGNS